MKENEGQRPEQTPRGGARTAGVDDPRRRVREVIAEAARAAIPAPGEAGGEEGSQGPQAA